MSSEPLHEPIEGGGFLTHFDRMRNNAWIGGTGYQGVRRVTTCMHCGKPCWRKTVAQFVHAAEFVPLDGAAKVKIVKVCKVYAAARAKLAAAKEAEK